MRSLALLATSTVLAGVLLTGCGSSGDSGSATSTTTKTATVPEGKLGAVPNRAFVTLANGTKEALRVTQTLQPTSAILDQGPHPILGALAKTSMAWTFAGTSSTVKLTLTNRITLVTAMTLSVGCRSPGSCTGTSVVDREQAGRASVNFADDTFTVTIR